MKRPSVSHFKVDRAWKGEIPFNKLSPQEKSVLNQMDELYRESARYLKTPNLPAAPTSGFLKTFLTNTISSFGTAIGIGSAVVAVTLGTIYVTNEWNEDHAIKSKDNPKEIRTAILDKNQWKRVESNTLKTFADVQWRRTMGEVLVPLSNLDLAPKGSELEVIVSNVQASQLYVGVFSDFESDGQPIVTKIFPTSSELVSKVMLTPGWTMPQKVLFTGTKAQEVFYVFMTDKPLDEDFLGSILTDIKTNAHDSINFYKKGDVTLEVHRIHLRTR